MFNLGLAAFHFYNQKRLAVRISRTGIIFADTNQHTVHKLDRHRQNTRLDNVRDTSPRDFIAVKSDQHRPRALGLVQDAQRGFRDNAKLPLTAANKAQQIKPTRVQMCATDLDDLSIHHHHGDTHEIVGRHPIFQAMRAARVHRDVARNSTGKLARRVGRIEKAFALHSPGDREVRAPRLHANNAAGKVCLQNSIHTAHTQDHTVRRWHSASR